MYYFGLPEGWTPDQVPNKAALGLLRRFVHNGYASHTSLGVRSSIDCFRRTARTLHGCVSDMHARLGVAFGDRCHQTSEVFKLPCHALYLHPVVEQYQPYHLLTFINYCSQA